VVIVNSLADAENDWGTQEKPPDVVSMLIRATGVPIDRYSYEQVELLRDFVRALRRLRGPDGQPLAVEFYAIDINFDAIADPEEKRYFRNLPTSFVLTNEQVDRLREIAGRLLRQSPDSQRLLRDLAAAANPGQACPFFACNASCRSDDRTRRRYRSSRRCRCTSQSVRLPRPPRRTDRDRSADRPASFRAVPTSLHQRPISGATPARKSPSAQGSDLPRIRASRTFPPVNRVA
jgi:hypothetical protein